MTDFSLLCSFVPGSEKSANGTFAPVELHRPTVVVRLQGASWIPTKHTNVLFYII